MKIRGTKDIPNGLDLANEWNDRTLELVHYFCQNCTDKILANIDRLNIKDTGTLRNSIEGVVRYNAGSGKGASALVLIYFATYGPYVEQAVGKYYGVDAALGKGRGIRSREMPYISEDPITSATYAPLHGNISPAALQYYTDKQGNKQDRGAKHRPRPFIRNVIRYEIERISFRLLEELGNTMEIHCLGAIVDAMDTDEQTPITDHLVKLWDSLGFKVHNQ